MTGSQDPGDDGRLPLPAELSPRARTARPGGRRWIRIGSWVAVGASVLVLGLSGAAFGYYLHLKGNIHGITVKITGSRPATAKDGAENILLVGDDDRAGLTPAELAALNTTDDGGSDNTDTIIILHLAPDNGPATLVSIPRDSFVAIPGHSTFKINSAYADGIADGTGGPALLIKTVEQLSGLHIDHFISVGFGQFVNISNAVGGVQVCVDNPGFRGYQGADEGDVPDADVDGAYDVYSGVSLSKGVHTLKGAQALAFVRQRHDLPAGDLDRIHRQQRFITAIEQKATSTHNPAEINAVLETATRSLTVDNGLKKGLALVDLADRLRGLKPDQIRFATVPVLNSNAVTPSGTSYVELNTPKLATFFANLKAERDPNAPAPAAPSPLAGVTPATPAETTVTVENGSGVSHAAGNAQALLRSYGFQVPAVGTVAVTATTTIRYNPADAAEAVELTRSVTGATLVADSTQSAGTLQLVLGTGSAGVHSPVTATPSSASPTTPTAASSADTTTNAATLGQGQTIDGVPCGP